MPAVDLDVLHNASNILVEQLSKDAQIIPDFGDIISSCTFLCSVHQTYSNYLQP